MNIILPIALLCVCTLVHAARLGETALGGKAHTVRDMYRDFKEKYQKNYDGQEDEFRFKVFQDNLRKALEHNSANGDHAEYGITQFSDLSEKEFKRTRANLKNPRTLKKRPVTLSVDTNTPIPNEWDWRKIGGVSEVKDQGQCGSCWAFSAVGNIEGQWYKKTGNTLSFSEQQLVDCDNIDDGCEGGLMLHAFDAIEREGGIETESAYPYDARDERCSLSKGKFSAYVNSSSSLPEDETEIAKYLHQHGPISVAINADTLQMYDSGILHPSSWECDPGQLDHGVLIVGYGTEQSTPYWIVKNSWGPDWGEEGYFRMYRGDGTCGINTYAVTSIIL